MQPLKDDQFHKYPTIVNMKGASPLAFLALTTTACAFSLSLSLPLSPHPPPAAAVLNFEIPLSV